MNLKQFGGFLKFLERKEEIKINYLGGFCKMSKDQFEEFIRTIKILMYSRLYTGHISCEPLELTLIHMDFELTLTKEMRKFVLYTKNKFNTVIPSIEVIEILKDDDSIDQPILNFYNLGQMHHIDFVKRYLDLFCGYFEINLVSAIIFRNFADRHELNVPLSELTKHVDREFK